MSKNFAKSIPPSSPSTTSRFEIPRGEIFGLLGPNGAGKTTTIRMLMDIIKPDAGRRACWASRPARSRRRVGYLPEERGLYRTLRVIECLAYLGELKGLSRSAARKRARQFLERVELGDWGKRKVDELSRGMQQKVQLIASIIHDPELVILDEPFQGLDPVNAEMVRQPHPRPARPGQDGGALGPRDEPGGNAVRAHRAHQPWPGGARWPAGRDQAALFAQRHRDQPAAAAGRLAGRGSRGPNFDGRQRVTLAEASLPRDLLKQIVDRGLALDTFERASATLDEIFITVVKGAATMPTPTFSLRPASAPWPSTNTSSTCAGRASSFSPCSSRRWARSG